MNTKQDARKLDMVGKEDLRRRVVRAVVERGLSKAEAAFQEAHVQYAAE